MDEVSRIREKTDIVSLISEYIPLKKLGRNFKANCPFHNEKSPSFVVSPERQIWHCFGCAKGGDAFTFLMEYDNMEFIEALRLLAKKTGIELSNDSFKPGMASKKEKIYNLNKLALDFYHYLLIKHNVGKKALSYLLEERKLTPAILNTFSLGFAPGIGDALCSYLTQKKGYRKEDLLEAGLGTFQRGRLVDFFRGRIIFPLYDHRDNIVGFSGRIFGNTSSDISKYINTKDTLVYHKGELFFGLNTAKDEIKKQEQAIIVEGELDVISCFMQGVSNVVAIKGTALTDRQAALISRYTPKVTLCLDQDSAGFEATKRSLSVLEKEGLTTTVIVLPEGKDPDEAIKTNLAIFKKAMKDDIGVYDFMLSKLLLKFSKETIDGKKKITDEMLPLLVNIQNEVVKEHYVRKLSAQIDTSAESLIRQMEKTQKKEETKGTFIGQSKDKRERKEAVEEYLMSLVVQSDKPKYYFDRMISILEDYEFEEGSYGKIVDKLLEYFKKYEKLDTQVFLTWLPKELLKTFDIWILLPLPKFADEDSYEGEIEKIAKELKTLYLKKKARLISEKLKKEKISDDEQESLRRELSSILSHLSPSN